MSDFKNPPAPAEEGIPPWHSIGGDAQVAVLKNIYSNLFCPAQTNGSGGGYAGIKDIQLVLSKYKDGSASWDSTVTAVNTHLKNYNRTIGPDGNPTGGPGPNPNLSQEQVALLYRILMADAFNSRLAPFDNYALW